MASLRDTVKDYQDELRDGFAWVAFWKQGRSWNAEYFHLDMDDTLYPVSYTHLDVYKRQPKDLSKVKTKVAFNLTKRQIVCFAAALLFGLPLFFLPR